MNKIFTADWFDRCIPLWEKYLEEFKDKPNLNFLEIGSYEGRSTCWLLENILTDLSSKITCIDIFEGAPNQNQWSKELYSRYDMSEVTKNFFHNTSEYADRINVLCGYSQKQLRSLGSEPLYDLIYIDASHIAADVLEDIILSFRLLKNNGIMIFDDYEWKMFDDPLRHPGIAINAFLEVYKKRYSLILKDKQVIIRKIEFI